MVGDDAARPAWIVNELGVCYRMAEPGFRGDEARVFLHWDYT